MKTTNRILLASLATATLSLAGTALAQPQLSGPDGLATSPRYRQQLSERPVLVVTPVPAVVTSTEQPSPVTASPRAQEVINQNQKSSVAPSQQPVVTSPGTQNSDNVAASPRLQQQRSEQPQQFQIAPVK